VGELLFKISGISGKADINEDEEADVVVAESSRRALMDLLGKERRDKVLASLYLVRQDAVAAVRQACIHIWKALVHNTPRTGKRYSLCTLVSWSETPYFSSGHSSIVDHTNCGSTCRIWLRPARGSSNSRLLAVLPV